MSDAFQDSGVPQGQALMGIEPSRVAALDFTPPVVQFDYTFLVPGGSTIASVKDADQPGIRIAVVRKIPARNPTRPS